MKANVMSMKPHQALCCAVLLLTAAEAQSYAPKDGFVPDAMTAVKIAEAVLTPVYGKEKIESERPVQGQTGERGLDCKWHSALLGRQRRRHDELRWRHCGSEAIEDGRSDTEDDPLQVADSSCISVSVAKSPYHSLTSGQNV